MLDPFVILAPVLLLPVVGLLRFIGCASFSSEDIAPSSTTPVLNINPSTVTLGPGGQQQFSGLDSAGADVSMLIAWSVDNGKISTGGLYTAPSPFVPGSAPVTVTGGYIPPGSTVPVATAKATITLVAVTVIVTPNPASVAPGQTQDFTGNVAGTISNLDISRWVDGSGTVLPIKAPTVGTYTAPAPFKLSRLTDSVTATSKAAPGASGTAVINLVSGNTVTPVGMDTTTQGNWVGKYGADGFAIVEKTPGNIVKLPGYLASLNLASLNVFDYADPTADVRGLSKPAPAVGRVGDVWFPLPPAATLVLDFSFTDFKPHRVAIYFVDWDSEGRVQTVQWFDEAQAAPLLLDNFALSAFSGGVYRIWNVTGTVRLVVTATVANPVFSGIFFG